MPKKINEMKTTFESRSANEAYARVAAAAFISQLDPTMEELTEIRTAVSEAVTNSIVHGYDDKIGTVMLKIRIFEGGIVEMVISDKGKGINDISEALKPLFTTCTTGERSGMGFTIMESFTDKLRVKSSVGKGTTVIMRKKLNLRG